jgi:hypothetical protein
MLLMGAFRWSCDGILTCAPVENSFGQREIFRIGDLEVLRAAAHQPGRQAHRLHGAGFVGDTVPGLLQRVDQHADAEHLRRLRQPFAAAVYGARDAAAVLRLLSVSGSFCASRPPTASSRQA